jgi:hypothetical protein
MNLHKFKNIKPIYLLLIAALFHLTFAVLLEFSTRNFNTPNTIRDGQLGAILFIDSARYQREMVSIAECSKDNGVSCWSTPIFFHVKLYALLFALLNPFLHSTILAIEPLNLFFYLSILVLIYKIGKEIMSKEVGIIAATIVAIWPSFLLHTTQPLRDLAFICAMLILVYICIRLLTRFLPSIEGLLSGLKGISTIMLLWIAKSSMWEVVIVIIGLSLILLLYRCYKEKSLQKGNIIALLLILLCSIILPKVSDTLRNRGSAISKYLDVKVANQLPPEACAEFKAIANQPKESSLGILWNRLNMIPARVGYLRCRFILQYPNAGSNIDVETEIDSLAAFIKYLPRAAMIGFMAPFPNTWFVKGTELGLAGRVLAGFETLIMWIIQIFTLYALYIYRQHLAVWLLFLIAFVGAVSLGLVVVNIGALYRMRYIFVILQIILGVAGTLHMKKTYMQPQI